MDIRKSFAKLAALLSFGMLSTASLAVTTVDIPWALPGTYQFSGTCLDCGPSPSPATATLSVPASGGGVTFEFASSNFATPLESIWVEVYRLDPLTAAGPARADILFGTVKTAAPGTGNGTTDWRFTSDSQGSWNLAPLGDFTADFGNQGTWATSTAPIPEPSTYALMALGLGALAVASRRRRQVA